MCHYGDAPCRNVLTFPARGNTLKEQCYDAYRRALERYHREPQIIPCEDDPRELTRERDWDEMPPDPPESDQQIRAEEDIH